MLAFPCGGSAGGLSIGRMAIQAGGLAAFLQQSDEAMGRIAQTRLTAMNDANRPYEAAALQWPRDQRPRLRFLGERRFRQQRDAVAHFNGPLNVFDGVKLRFNRYRHFM